MSLTRHAADTPPCLQESPLLSFDASLLEHHVVPHLSLRDLASLSCSCRGLRQQVAELPEAVWQALAEQAYPASHPVCRSGDVRSSLQRQHRLAASLRSPPGWREDVLDAQHVAGYKAISPDFRLLAVQRTCGVPPGPELAVSERTTSRTVARTRLPASTATTCAFSWNGDFLAAAFVNLLVDPHASELLLLSLESGAQASLGLGTLLPTQTGGADHILNLAWAPSAAVLAVAVLRHQGPKLLLVTPSGAVLSEHDSWAWTRISWAPDSQSLCSTARDLVCFDLVTSERHSHPANQTLQRSAWVPGPVSAPQLLLLCERPHAGLVTHARLLSAPALVETCAQELPLEVYSISCAADAVAIEEAGSQSRLWLYSFVRQAVAGQPPLRVLQTLPHPAEASQPVFSPAGGWLVRITPYKGFPFEARYAAAVLGAARLELIAVSGPSAGSVTSRNL